MLEEMHCKQVIWLITSKRTLTLKLPENPWRILAICIVLGAAIRFLGGDFLDKVYTQVGMQPMPWQND
jgi:hypothetical protein